MNPRWMVLLAVILASASAQTQFSSEEESTSDDWTLWTPTESAEQGLPPPVDVTTTEITLTEIITAVTETEATTLPATTTAKAAKVRATTTAPPPEEDEEEEEEELTTTEAITTTKRPRSKSKTTTAKTTTTTTTTTTEFNPLAGGLSEFLKRRRLERIMATTEVDPFIAILATATPPSTSSTEQLTESSVSPSSGSSVRFNKRRKNQNRVTTAAPPVVRTPDPIDIPAIRLISNRLNNNQLKRKSFGRTTTATSQRTTTEQSRSSTASSRSRFTPKRPSLNRANARKEVTTTVSAFGEEATITDAPERSSRTSTARRTNGLRFRANRI